MTRRAWLMMLGAMAATAAGVVAVADKVRPATLAQRFWRLEGFGSLPLDRLRAHYGWLPVEAGVLERYVSDYQRVFGPITRLSVTGEDFFTRLLLSTDFFSRPAGTPSGNAPVRYMGFYYPSESPCYNPIAQGPPTDAEIQAAHPGIKR
jgi:hypothetical protein